MEVSELDKITQRIFDSIVGLKVIKVNFVNINEGIYEIYFDNGQVAHFSSHGDDMTFTTFELTL